jgi:hypothetical protein
VGKEIDMGGGHKGVMKAHKSEGAWGKFWKFVLD